MNIGVFCSARDLGPEFTEPVKDFAKHVGEHGHTLVWGGSSTGLMAVVAEGVKAAGGRLVGITIEHYRGDLFKEADEVVIAQDLFDRKRQMIERSDAFVILPGGIGTIDEATDIIELKREGAVKAPIVFLNSKGFYDHLREEFEEMNRDGTLDTPVDQLVQFADKPHLCLDLLVAGAKAAGLIAKDD